MTGANRQNGRRRPQGSLVRRTAAAAVVIALVAVAFLFAITDRIVAEGQTLGLAAAVNADMAGLADIYATSGRGELIARLSDRHVLTARDGRRTHYLLRDPRGVLGGDQRAWAPLSAATSQEGYVTIDAGVPAFARATELAPGLELMVAREYAPERATRTKLAWSFLIAGVGIALAVLALARWRSGRLAARLTLITRAYRDEDPDTLARLLTDPHEDEVGEVARLSGGSLARLRRLLDTQRHVSDHIAHELRTPLLHLEGRLRGLAKAGDADAEKVVALAGEDIRGITSMLDSLLDIAANENSRTAPADLAPFDLSRLATDLAELYRGSMEEAGLHLAATILPDVMMKGEAMQIGRLIVNLLDNAIKYVPAGGTVRLQISAGPTIVVADDGPGMPEGLDGSAFDRFRRGANAVGTPGHGLGLALAHAIAERHGCRLALIPTPRGCNFTIRPGGIVDDAA